MKFNNDIKQAIIDKLAYSVLLDTQLKDLVALKTGLEEHKILKGMAYSLFEDKTKLVIKDSATLEEKIALKWINDSTKAIEKDFNKGRKITRQFKNLFSITGGEARKIINSSLNSDILGLYTLDNLDINALCNEDSIIDNMINCVSTLKKYISCVLLIDMLTEEKAITILVIASIHANDIDLLDAILEIGGEYIGR